MLASIRTQLDGAPGVRDVRGVGLLLGVELAPGQAVAAAEHLLAEGIIVLPAGDRGEVLELSPPAALTTEQEAEAVRLVCQVVRQVASS
jgi:acetylornithine/succinyldiaminopimelate/putrescine aminotransferase